MMRFILALLLLLSAAPAFAQTTTPETKSLADPALESRARNLQRSLRCLVCQGESVDESGSDFAADIRRLVHREIATG